METFFDKGEGRDIKTLHLKDVIYECPLNVNQAKIHKKNPYFFINFITSFTRLFNKIKFQCPIYSREIHQ